MATVDDKVVAMSFESSKFESGVNSTVGALNKLKASLQFPNAGKDFANIDSAARQVDLSHIAKGVDSIKSKFSAMSVIAISALATVASRAVTAGLSFVKSLTLDPVIAGFHNYETQINAVQTILANTGLTGKKGLQQVTNVLADLNKYANQTVYNFSEMAKNIGTFTAAGVDLKTSAASIKGIANLAALSGSNSEQASTAMYQLSQAIAANQVKLQDWNSVVNAGMGGKVFQSALFNTAKALGTIKNVPMSETFKQWTNAGNSFRGSLQQGWITGKVLTTTLEGFTGDLTISQLKAKGYTTSQAKEIQKLGQTAKDAATNIKTMSQLTQALKEEVATAWGAVFGTIFGNINQATTLFSKVHVVAEAALTKPIYSLNTLLQGWAKLGGRTKLIQGVKQAFQDLGAVMKPIGQAWRQVFPATTAQALYNLTVGFGNLMKALKPSATTIAGLKGTFAGLFAVLSIGKQILSGIFTALSIVFGAATKGGTGFLTLTSGIGSFLVAVNAALKRGGALHNFFVKLGNALAIPVRFVAHLTSALVGLFTGIKPSATGGVAAAISGIGVALAPLHALLYSAEKAWHTFMGAISGAGPTISKIFASIGAFFANLGPTIAHAISNTNFSGVFTVIQTGLLGGIFLLIKKFFTGGNFIKAFGGGVLKSVSGALEGLTGSLEALQANIKADTLKTIAIAVGILAASIIALSLIPADKVNNAMSTLTIAFGQLLGAMAILTNISKNAGFLKVPFIAAGMVALATAIGILTLAVRNLSGLDWNSLAKGLAGVSVLLIGISKTAAPLSRSSAGLITAGIGISAIAVAMKILAGAVASFGGLSWAQLGKGLASVAVALGSIGLAARTFPSGMVAIGLGLIGVATGLKLLAGAVSTFGNMDLSTIAKGIIGIAGALVAIGLALKVMPSSMIGQAAGLVLVSVALKGIAAAIASFGGMSIGALAKGIGSLAVSLGVLAVALIAMSGSVSGAVALGVAAASLALLAPALTSLGKQSWGSIVKGLVSLTAALVILGVAGIALAPVAPALLALGAALLAIGGGLALAGTGIALVGTGLSAIAVAGPIAVGVLVKAFVDFVAAIPKVAASFVQGLVAIVTQIGNAAPQFLAAFEKILTGLLNATISLTPLMVKAFGVLLTQAELAIENNLPGIIKTGFDILIALLKGINNNINRVTIQVVAIITTMLNTISGRLPQLVAAGARSLVSFLNGIANNIGSVVTAALNVVLHFVTGIANNLRKIISAGADIVVSIVTGIGNGAGRLISAGGTAIAHIITGIGNAGGKLVSAATRAIGDFITEVGKAALGLTNEGAQAIVNFMNGVANTIKKYEPQMLQAGARIGAAIVQGMINGIASLAGSLIHRAEGLVTGLPGAVKKILHIGSPSQVFYDLGVNVVQGLANGISQNADLSTTAVEDMTNSLVDTMTAIPNVLDGLTDMNPTITPILDLTQVQTGAEQLNGLLNKSPVTAGVSFGQASSISTDHATATSADSADAAGAPSIKFEQNNYSPEALSEIEIYRQTRNQIGQLKKVLVLA